MPFQHKVALACATLLFFDFIIYLLTQASTVQFIDSGELAVVCKTLGIAHPTGYPFYTLLGRLFCLLPIRDIVFRVGLMSLLFTCTANIILFFTFLAIYRSFPKEREERLAAGVWSAFVACLIFSFTPTLWSQATSNEVYSLNVLFYSLIILLVLRWRREKKKSEGERILYLLAFVYALSFGNHMSTVLLLPGLMFIVVSGLGKRALRLRRVGLICIVFLLGVSVYLFLPIRSSQNPIMDWGNPESGSALVRHVTGWQYQVWMFAQSAQQVGGNLQNFVRLFFHQFPFYLLPLSFLGIRRLLAHNRKILVFLLMVFFANILYGINYGIPDIDPYFLGSFLVNAVFIGIGIHLVFQVILDSRIKKGLSHLIIALFLLLPLFLLKMNYFEADRSRSFFAYDFGSNIMRSVKKDAVILTNVWDHYSPWLYLRFIQFKRPDVSYLDTELCRRSWYYNYFAKTYPDLFQTSESEIKRFLKEVYPFEHRRTFEPQVIEKAYLSMLNSFLAKNLKNKPLYEGFVGGPKVGKMYSRIPEGMVFALKQSLKYYPYEFPDLELRGVLNQDIFKNERTLFNVRRYPLMIDLRLRYLAEFRRREEADTLLKKYQTLFSKR